MITGLYVIAVILMICFMLYMKYAFDEYKDEMDKRK